MDPLQDQETPPALYTWLIDRQAQCNVVDAHLFARILARRWPAGRATLGLDTGAKLRLVARYFPAVLSEPLPFRPPPERHLSALLAGEAADLTDLLLAHRSQGAEEEQWLAAIIGRACLDSGPLWQDLGLTGPRQLAGLFERHFNPLAALNPAATGWRALLYRLHCARHGLLACRDPVCHDCGAGAVCFGAVE